MEQGSHTRSSEEIVDQLGVNPEVGLTLAEVQERRDEYGLNVLAQRRAKPGWLRFLMQFHQPLVYILIIATLMTALLGEFIDSGVILGVILLNAIIGFTQESKALSALAALAQTMHTHATVLRHSKTQLLSAEELVPGDIVLLKPGDKVPADLRLVKSRELQIDESTLTGESVPVEKNSEIRLDLDTDLADRKNIAYASTLVTYGNAKGVVVATAEQTEIGRISKLLSSTEELKTPLTQKIAAFSHMLLWVILGLASITFVIGYFTGRSLLEMFMTSVALAVSAIPEGLPAAVTITLAVGVSRMAKRHAIIRKLPAVETLGSTTVICSDKTGTLTQNQMTVLEVFAGGQSFRSEGKGYDPKGSFHQQGNGPVKAGQAPALDECLRAGLLCNDSELIHKEGNWVIQGDPTEGALIVSARRLGFTKEDFEKRFPRIDAIPFESQHQFMVTLHRTSESGGPILYLKGALEAVMERCDSCVDHHGGETSIDKAMIVAEAERMAQGGLRVLGFARRKCPEGTEKIGHQDVQAGLAFLGLQGMIDPPRPEAIQAIDECRGAGLRVKMITGDHATTAEAIASRIHLVPEGRQPKAVTGRELAKIGDSELPVVAEETHVFARVTPEQKLRLVKALQVRGHVVAMTGDGVNDGPALKRADIGVAMGIAGTEVAKEAAEMVLTDDNFASIVAAVEEGRGVFANLTKFIVWTLPTNGGESSVIITSIVFGTILPIEPVQILWINMTTAVLLGMMLAFEPKEPDSMTKPPREPSIPILTSTLIWRIVLVSALLLIGTFVFFQMELGRGQSEAYARTVAVNVLIFGELFYLFNCRSLTRSVFHIGLFTNRPLWIGVLLTIGAQLLFTYVPLMNNLFRSAPIDLRSWLHILTVGAAVAIIVEIEKLFLRNGDGRKKSRIQEV